MTFFLTTASPPCIGDSDEDPEIEAHLDTASKSMASKKSGKSSVAQSSTTKSAKGCSGDESHDGTDRDRDSVDESETEVEIVDGKLK